MEQSLLTSINSKDWLIFLFRLLPPRDLFRLKRVCKMWHELIVPILRKCKITIVHRMEVETEEYEIGYALWSLKGYELRTKTKIGYGGMNELWYEMVKTATKRDDIPMIEFMLNRAPRDQFEAGSRTISKVPIFLAAERGNKAIVDRWIRRFGVKLSIQQGLLHLAAREGHLDIVKVLAKRPTEIKHFMCLDHPNDRGLTPLASACYGGQVEVVEYLMEKCGANPNGSYCSAFPVPEHVPIIIAIQRKYVGIVDCLLRHGTSVSIYLGSNDSILHTAVRSRNTNIVKLLLKYGADPNVSTKDGGCSAATLAYMNDLDEIIKLFNRATIGKKRKKEE